VLLDPSYLDPSTIFTECRPDDTSANLQLFGPQRRRAYRPVMHVVMQAFYHIAGSVSEFVESLSAHPPKSMIIRKAIPL
jgi:hypothetical protein